jgi:hypothetical protein
MPAEPGASSPRLPQRHRTRGRRWSTPSAWLSFSKRPPSALLSRGSSPVVTGGAGRSGVTYREVSLWG